MHIRLFSGFIAVISLAGIAGAAPSLELSIAQCAGKTDAAARLACYDAVAAQLKVGQVPASASPLPAPAAANPAPAAALRPALDPAPVAAPVVAPPPAAAPVAAAAPPPAAKPEAQFGSEQMPKEVRQATGQPEEADAISSALKSFTFTATGRVIVTLENGQIWRQTEGDTEKFRAKQGEIVTIARAIFGSYNMTIEGRSGLFKVRRLR